METYILLAKLTAEGRKTVQERPDRVTEVNQDVEAMGAKVVSQWAVLGPYDFISVVEAPDNETIAQVSLALGGRGTVELLTLPAISLPHR